MGNKPVAILLAAGRGMRLRPLTEDIPKPLVQVTDEPIIIHTLRTLKTYNVRECIIVVGYKQELIREAVAGLADENFAIKFVYADRFKTTNNIYSLWCAREYLCTHDVLLLESDVFFDPEILYSFPGDRNASRWFVDRFHQNMDGALLEVGDDERISKIRIVREQLPEYAYNFYKSIGILWIRQEDGCRLAGWLDEAVVSGRTDIYYDLLLAEKLHELPLKIQNIHGYKWWEIDTEEDLVYAQSLFIKTDS